MSDPHSPTSRRLTYLVFALTAAISLVLPWWRNHDRLRDLMDYGLVMAASGRIEAGERPYVDFLTPIQAGYLELNHGVEKLGGGDYRALTRGAMAGILGGFVLLLSIGRRRLPPWVALPVAWAVVAGSMAQHTILWHNSLGVLLLLAVAWSAALAPTFDRREWPLHTVLALALMLGGVNKLSYQLVALVVAMGLAMRAGMLGRASARAVAGMLGVVVLAGIAVPLGAELLWTGADWATWRANVIDLAAGDRAHHLTALATRRPYLGPLHDYYGPMLLPPIGAIAVGLAAVVLGLGWRGRSGLDRVFLGLAALSIPVVTLALIVTNQEIIYVAGAAGIGLAAAVVLAFEIKPRLAGGIWAVLIPMVVVGGASWWSAWQGQRSQFGDSTAARADYRVLAEVAPEYAYLAGVKLPPELVAAYQELVPQLPAAGADGLRAVFYGTGAEWLERVWPARKFSGQPLWMHDGTTYGPAQRRQLAQLINPPASFDTLVIPVRWDAWPSPAYVSLDLFTRQVVIGGQLKVYQTGEGINLAQDPLHLINLLRTNYVASLLRFNDSLVFAQDENVRVYFGRDTVGSGDFHFDGVVNLMKGDLTLRRLEATAADEALRAHFAIEYEALGDWHLIWEGQRELAAGVDAVVLPYEFDGRRRPLRFTVTVPPESAGKLLAGWYAPLMNNSVPTSEDPPALFSAASPVTPVSPGLAEALIGPDWRPDRIFGRGAEVTAKGVELGAGDQLWLRADAPLDALDGFTAVDPGADGAMPYLSILWYQGGRVQITDSYGVSREDPVRRFHSWSAGKDGWFGIIIDPRPGTNPVTVRIENVTVGNW